MREVARQSPENLRALIANTSAKTGLSAALVEKDFWVCWLLDFLFCLSPWRKRMAFKGGTSLSKAYGLIERFSEDVDLILDWRLLGYRADEPWEPRSNTRQDIFNERANAQSAAFLSEQFVPQLTDGLSEALGRPVDVRVDEDDPNTVVFRYPQTFADSAILRGIRLECGCLAAWTPARIRPVRPYAAEVYPRLFSRQECGVFTVEAERTFWEKATILHREAMRTERQGPMPPRYSRHYYDLWCMCRGGTKDAALARLPLLAEVVAFKRKFYRCAWARYEEATPQAIRLVPPESAWPALEADYAHMQNMIFGARPAFREILDTLRALETELHTIPWTPVPPE